ncbi:hypothetical protein HLV37_01895 [Eggerthellaceae bacterium zg-1084]|uniref:Uncharacterized protein n=2 Tax=Berryella wangjianweii TaxID=2734634 RepID=A0A6M8J831_9ACTN|nr:hypothetical protein [Berryella wangjianweii]NPD32149.1 hypothetical protein [Eggerthellaceae bacterium zg-997]QKF08006.1 hypothetical protein HLV38_03460 [Berryella wangjianweii]
MRALNCSSCSAQLIVDQTTAVSSCPYCGNPTVVPGQLAGALRPDAVIPFKQTREQAIEALRRHYRHKPLLPKAFSRESHLEEVQGVYVPFWLYTARAEGLASFAATTVTTWTDSENTYTSTSHYRVERAGEMEFVRVPADGSTKMPDAHMDAIEPFDYREMRPFSVGYLPGFVADRYDLNAADCRQRAEERMRATVADRLGETVSGYATTTVESCLVDIDWTQVSYALLPVWMLHTRWRDKDYLFAMNGQTGRLVGDLPVDRTRAAVGFAGIALATSAVAFFLFMMMSYVL